VLASIVFFHIGLCIGSDDWISHKQKNMIGVLGIFQVALKEFKQGKKEIESLWKI